jgi:Co/Zn/Cd efflux system component
MRVPTGSPPRAPAPTGRAGQERQSLALLLGAVGLCAVIGVAAAWTLLFGPPTVPGRVMAVVAVAAVAGCVGVVIRERGHRIGR